MKRIFEITIFALLEATLAACGNDADSKAIEKIQTFYSRHIFGNEFANDSVIAKYCTKELAQKLRDDYDNEYSDDGGGYAVWKFRSGAQDGKDINTNGNLRMRYGDVIQLTLVDPVLGIAEIGRIELSPNKVLIIDRVNKRYVDTTYEDFSALKSRDIDFNTIQEFFWQESKKGDTFAYTIPAKKDIKLDLKLSNKGSNANWEAHTTVSDRYTKTDANKLFDSMIGK